MVSNNKKRPETWAKRFALNLKTTEDIRQKVEERAQKSGRSITLEVEQQLIKSFEIEEKDALNEEIKAEMRGTIAALEARIASMEEREAAMWPDESARLLGKAFSMALDAAQHVIGANWRESPAVVEIVTGAIREVMAKSSRPVGLFASLAPADDRLQPAATAIARSLSDYLASKMPPLPEADRNNTAMPVRARMVTTFRDRATRETLRVATGPEFDPTNPGDRPQQGPEVRAAMDYFRPRRDTVDIEVSLSYEMQDGSSAWEVLDKAQPAQPTTTLVGQERAAALMAGNKPARGQLPSSIGDRALFDETMSDPRPDDGDPTPPAPADTPAPRPRRRVKAPT